MFLSKKAVLILKTLILNSAILTKSVVIFEILRTKHLSEEN